MKKYSLAELKEKATLVFERFPKADKVVAFADGNLFLGDKKNAIANHKKATGEDGHTIHAIDLAEDKKAPAKKTPAKKKEAESETGSKED